MKTKPQETAGLATFTGEILNRKLHFCAVMVEYFGKLLQKKRFSKEKPFVYLVY